ncbi:polysaccharide deacetylase family protein [Candidatus Daviesbacteria bacterium]|nr:polysaccharide deacetylase family protein [Candidatus Daviesbacteria bacterium]
MAKQIKKKKSKSIKLNYKNPLLLILLTILAILVAILIIKLTLITGYTPKVPANTAKPKTASVEAVKKVESDTLPVQTSGYQVRVPILMYHYIGNNPDPKDLQRDVLSVTPDKFEEQMKYLVDNGYQTISLDTLYAALNKITTLPNKPVILTFDDGYVDFFYNAYPILLKYNLRATEFISTGLLGQGAYLNWDQIMQMNSSGLISFEAHSVHHYHLPSLSNEAILFELRESKKELEQHLGIPVNFIAYPYGSADGRIIDLVRQAGYVGALGTWPGKFQSTGTIYDMPRLRIGGGVDMKYFISLL